jgi:N6-adenosine-specific RNA methylase IME4
VTDLPSTPGGWRCVLADPPWRFSDKNTRGAAERHYPTMSGDEIAAMPVGEIVAPDSVLALWVPDTHLELALAIAKAWGFTYRHLVIWGKVSAAGKVQIGLGHRFRKAHEIALLCTRGKPAVLSHAEPSLILAPRTRHSAKPIDLHRRLERFCAGPRLELFARAAVPGWTGWGNEAPAVVEGAA